MYRLVTDAPGPEAELLDLYKQFYPADKAASAPDIRHRFARVCGGWQNEIGIDGREYAYFYAVGTRAADDALLAKRLEKRAAKLALYRSLADFSGLALPWGSLTGIRPTKLAYELLSEGIRPEALADTLCERYDVSPEKAALTARIVRAQAGYLTQDETRYNLYLHVPFCTTKCRYCSFISETADRAAALIPGYVELLRRETAAALSLIEKKGGRLFSVYVGGGTPTALSAGQLDAVLGEIPLSGIECTVEAGRPDTITQEKLAVLSARGVSRVCVNPQTFHDDTLIGMGRGHTVADFYRAYELARRFGFSLNLDLIAGLRGETAADFLHSLSCAAALAPENLTIHTLSRKRGAGLYGEAFETDGGVAAAVEEAHRVLSEKGYLPYYLYRQKNMAENLENTGYCLPGRQCVNNITVMEESLSVIACGAGAISKRVFAKDNRIERHPNLRDIKLYMAEFEDRLTRKERFFTE